jgi:DNA-binding transcriptional LysR family regulator
MRTVTCASPALLDACGIPKKPEDLMNFPCVAIETPMPSPSWRFRTPKTGALVDLQILPRLSVTTPEAAAQAAVANVGITRLLHYQAFEGVKNGDLQIILPEYEPEPAPVNLVHVSRLQMPLKTRRFLDFAIPRFRLKMNEIELPENSAPSSQEINVLRFHPTA